LSFAYENQMAQRPMKMKRKRVATELNVHNCAGLPFADSEAVRRFRIT